MFKKKRFPYLILFTLSCCVCVVAGISLLPQATAFIAQLGLPMIDSYPTVSPREPDTVILVSDDFSNPQSGWKTGSWNNGQVDYSNGGYLMSITDTNVYAYFEHPFPMDVSIEVDIATKGNAEVYFGITCRNQKETGYDFTFGGSKSIGIASPAIGSRSRDGITNFLPEQMTYGNTFFWPQNWGENYHIRVDCIGDQLSLYVNGFLVQKVSDSKYLTGGRIGLFGGHVNGANVTYLFDDFIVYQP